MRKPLPFSFISADAVQDWLARQAPVKSVEGPAEAPAKRTEVNWRGQRLVLGWITPRSHPFCNKCERVRLDARGRLRRCLMDPQFLELGSILQQGGREDAAEAYAAYLSGKHAPKTMESLSAMNLIGG